MYNVWIKVTPERWEQWWYFDVDRMEARNWNYEEEEIYYVSMALDFSLEQPEGEHPVDEDGYPIHGLIKAV